MEIKVTLPIIINCDNVGAIYLSNNNESRRTKHIDIKYHFVREYVDAGVVKIIFVTSKNNKADPFTKNLNKKVNDDHFDYMDTTS